MTKVKEKMLQCGRYLEKRKKVQTVFEILTLLIVLAAILLILLEKQRKIILLIGLIWIIIGTMIVIFSAAIKSFEDKSTEFVQKNGFWNIVLSSEEFISDLWTMIFGVTGVLYKYCTLKWLMILFMIMETIIDMFVTNKIAGFFKKRLKE